ncbi:hypothetical protein PIB30_019754, partial [Stylosanthes scabra]|nr:hypothetical protein [Stylosanthes scabra]
EERFRFFPIKDKKILHYSNYALVSVSLKRYYFQSFIKRNGTASFRSSSPSSLAFRWRSSTPSCFVAFMIRRFLCSVVSTLLSLSLHSSFALEIRVSKFPC